MFVVTIPSNKETNKISFLLLLLGLFFRHTKPNLHGQSSVLLSPALTSAFKLEKEVACRIPAFLKCYIMHVAHIEKLLRVKQQILPQWQLWGFWGKKPQRLAQTHHDTEVKWCFFPILVFQSQATFPSILISF